MLNDCGAFLVKGQFLADKILENEEFRVFNFKERLKEFLTLNGHIRANSEFPFEADISFPPTYKFLNRFVYALTNERSPSFTDRIFYISGEGAVGTLECKAYQCSFKTHRSDHKPIYGQFVYRGWSPIPPIGLTSGKENG